MSRKSLSLVLALLIFGFMPHEAASEDSEKATPPQFTFWEEIWLDRVFNVVKKNKAYAVGLGNMDWYSYGYSTLREARKVALDGCRAAVRKKFGKTVDPQCQLVAENDKLVWSGKKPTPLTENYLPQPDLPLARGMIFSTIRDAKGIVLHLHGCDGLGDTDSEWFSSWREFFTERGYAVVAPDSRADNMQVICGDDIPNTRLDPIIRLRVAQTLRTISGLRKRYPDKEIILWGHSGGGNVAQMIGYDIKGVIVTGTVCYPPASRKLPILHIYGSDDRSGLRVDTPLPITSKKVRKDCKNYSTKGAQRFVVVPKGDHWVLASDPTVQKALEEFLGRLPE